MTTTPPTFRRTAGPMLIWDGFKRDASAEGLRLLAGLVPGQTAGAPVKYREPGSKPYDLIDGVAVIPVYGAIYRHSTPLNDMFGYYLGDTSIDTLSDALRGALADPAARSILFTFNSPGGEVSGVGELAAAIREAGSAKPVAAYVESMCCSAAYWLAAACGEISAAPTSMVGSVGVKATMTDDSDYRDQIGVREITAVSDQSPDKNPDPTTEEGMALYTALMTDTAAVFVSDVAKYRNVPESTVLNDFGKGWVMIASKAKSAGMVDKIGVLGDSLRKLSGGNRARLAVRRPAAAMVKLSLRRA